MTSSALPRNPRLRKPSAVITVLHARQRTLAQLYRRRAILEKTIQSLEDYADTVEWIAAKVVMLR